MRNFEYVNEDESGVWGVGGSGWFREGSMGSGRVNGGVINGDFNWDYEF